MKKIKQRRHGRKARRSLRVNLTRRVEMLEDEVMKMAFEMHRNQYSLNRGNIMEGQMLTNVEAVKAGEKWLQTNGNGDKGLKT